MREIYFCGFWLIGRYFDVKDSYLGRFFQGDNFRFNYGYLKVMLKIVFYEIKLWKLNFDENS